jgi:hypothetical protein
MTLPNDKQLVRKLAGNKLMRRVRVNALAFINDTEDEWTRQENLQTLSKSLPKVYQNFKNFYTKILHSFPSTPTIQVDVSQQRYM